MATYYTQLNNNASNVLSNKLIYAVLILYYMNIRNKLLCEYKFWFLQCNIPRVMTSVPIYVPT